MTHVPTSVTTIAVALALALTPMVGNAMASPVPPQPTDGGVQSTTIEPVLPLRPIEVREIIDGVRTATATQEQRLLVADAVERFADSGWPLTNTEVRFDEHACKSAAGFHTEERGHHVVVMCSDAMWTLLHELGHVWSALYLDEAERAAWLESRALDSWSEGDWEDRGTEHAAAVIAFGLYDTAHVPMGFGITDYNETVSAFESLFGVAPLHRRS
jgi:hypothetical protein